MPMSDPKWTPDELVELCKEVLGVYRGVELNYTYRNVRLGGKDDGVMSLELNFGMLGKSWTYLVPIPAEVLAAIHDQKQNPYNSAAVSVTASRVISGPAASLIGLSVTQPPPGVEP